MRYKLLGYRYAELVHPAGAHPLGDPWGRGPPPIAAPQWRPPADLWETEEELALNVELAGIAEESLDVTLFEDVLVIEGSRECTLPPGARFYAAEIRYGRFRLEVPVAPSVDRARIHARYRDGFLTVHLPKGRSPA